MLLNILNVLQDTSKVTVHNQQIKHDRVDEELNFGSEKDIKTSTDRCNHNLTGKKPDLDDSDRLTLVNNHFNRCLDDEWNKKDDIFVEKELCALRDNIYILEQKIQNIDGMGLYNNISVLIH